MNDRTLCLLVKGDPIAEVLLGFKKTGFGAGKYTGIGGKVETGETVAAAVVRELHEETGVHVREQDLKFAGLLEFRFPAAPSWSQDVHVFLLRAWQGSPAESTEIRPEWFRADALPFDRMWRDAQHWLPPVLAGEAVRMHFVFAEDNATVHEVR